MKPRKIVLTIEIVTDQKVQELKKTVREVLPGVTHVETSSGKTTKKSSSRKPARPSRQGEQFKVW